jgi:hypothetical protein
MLLHPALIVPFDFRSYLRSQKGRNTLQDMPLPVVPHDRVVRKLKDFVVLVIGDVENAFHDNLRNRRQTWSTSKLVCVLNGLFRKRHARRKICEFLSFVDDTGLCGLLTEKWEADCSLQGRSEAHGTSCHAGISRSCACSSTLVTQVATPPNS